MIDEATWHDIREQCRRQGAKLVAVSKTRPPEAIEQYYRLGQRAFGENRVQELVEKSDRLDELAIEWHFIGNLQTKKVKYIAGFVSWIHSVDRLKLLREIDKRAAEHQRSIDCLLQFHIAREDTKAGLTFDEADALLRDHPPAQFPNVRLRGVMGMATYTSDTEQIGREFVNLYDIYRSLKEKHFSDVDYFNECSMGMSNDYALALEAGSTLVRVGSKLFQQRTQTSSS